jgi:hypothetical protein
MATGYWGNERQTVSGVHVSKDGKPICGYRPAKSMTFQVCSLGVYRPYVTCKKCLRKLDTAKVGGD